MGRIEVAVRQGGGVDLAGGEDGLQFGEREDLVDEAGHVLVEHLGLLGHTGPDEHAAHVGAVPLLHGQGGRDHGGHDGHEAVGQFGMVLAHVLHHSGAGTGYVHPLRLLAQVLVAGLVDQIGAVGHLYDRAEAQGAGGGDDLIGTCVEPGREGRSQEGGHAPPLAKQTQGLLDAVRVGLGVLRAHHGAVSTADAALGHHRGLAVLDADGLGRAVPHAGVAAAAVLLDGGDDAFHDAPASRPRARQ